MCRPNNKISKAAAQAFVERRPFRRDNTEVVVTSSSCAVLKLYGHVIGVTSGAFANGNGMYLAVPVDPLMVLNFSDPGMSLAEVARLEKSKN